MYELPFIIVKEMYLLILTLEYVSWKMCKLQMRQILKTRGVSNLLELPKMLIVAF